MDESKYWGAAMLAGDMPWYFLTIRVGDAGHELHETMLVSWETTLASVLAENAGAIVALYNACPDVRRSGKWAIHELVEVWFPIDGEEAETGPLLFRRRGSTDLWDSHQALRQPNSQRRLIVSLP